MTAATVVTNQQELDAALAAKAARIWIRSPEGLRLTVRDSGSSSVVLWESSSAVLWGSSSAELRGSSSAVLWGSSSAVLWESSSAELWGKFAVARQLSRYATATGSGVILDQREPVVRTVGAWADEFGVACDGERVTLFKAVGDEFEAGEYYTRTLYVPGTEVVAADFRRDGRCGGGLHLGPTVSCATYYRTDAKRWVEVTADVADLDVIQDGGAPKVKARACLVVREVDRRGRPVAS